MAKGEHRFYSEPGPFQREIRYTRGEIAVLGTTYWIPQTVGIASTWSKYYVLGIR